MLWIFNLIFIKPGMESNQNRTLLSIDCGTQSLRGMIFDVCGHLVSKRHVEYSPYYSENPGWAEQDAELFWNSLIRVCQELKAKDPDAFDKIAGIGITAQRASMVCVDKQGNPLRPVILWLDQRKAIAEYRPGIFLKTALKITKFYYAVIKTQADAKCNWIRQNQPLLWEKTHKYLQISGFLNFRLTGKFKDSTASQIGHIPFNYKKMRWCTRKELNYHLFPVNDDKLPELIEPGQIIGSITQDAAEATGLRFGLPVVACGSDKGCETIGMGVQSADMVNLSFGTTATVQTTTRKYIEALRFMPPYPCPLPGHYNPEVEIFRGFWMISWFKNEFAHKEVEIAGKEGVVPEVVLDRLLTQAPPGSMGLMVQPFWSPGLKHPEAKGAMIGFGDVHKKSHVYRAVIEGLGYALLEGMHKIEKKSGIKVEKVAVSGGATRSDPICQITADIFNRPLLRGQTFETSGLGAAIITSVGTGIYCSFDLAVRNMVHYEKIFRPDPTNVPIYRELYHKVYRRMYPALQHMYCDIRRITGYPE